MGSTELTRRAFVASTLTAASAARVAGANNRIRLGIIGAGGRGTYLMKEANRIGGIEWVAVCDAWDVRRDNAAETAGTTVAKYADYGELLDRKDIDAVIVATWDNMHALIAAAACRG